MTTKSTTLLVAALLGLGVTANAVAVTVYTTYTDRALFEAALATSTTEDFESYATIGKPDPLLPSEYGRSNLTLDEFSLAATPNAIKITDDDPYGSHNTTVGGAKFLYLDTDSSKKASETDFLLNDPVTAFGFDYTGVFEPGTAFTVTIGSDIFNPDLNNPEADALFWGVIGTASFNTVTLSTFTDINVVALSISDINGFGDSGYGVDDVTFGSAIPLPPAIWLFGSGLLALAGSGLKRRKHS